MPRCVLLIAPLVASVVVVGCRQVAGISDSPPEALTAELCGLPYGTPACAECVHASCCAESMVCAKDASCAEYQSCFGACKGDPACWSRCAIDHPTTAPAMSALSACMARQCEDACDLTCGGFAGRPFSPATAGACQSCLTRKHCAELHNCATSVGCDTAIRCIASSTTYDLSSNCELTDGVYPSWGWDPDAGSGNALTQYFVAMGSCGPACSGTDWHCAGHVNWPQLPAVLTPYTIRFLVRDYSSSAPEEGVLVEVCGYTDIDCAMPYASDTTNAAGQVSLAFENVAAGAQTHGLEGYLRITRSDLEPAYFYWGFPLSGSTLSQYTDVATVAELGGLNQSVGVTQDPSRGSVSVAAYDCQFGPAPGVQITLSSADGATKGFNTSGGPATATDASGLLLFANVPAGYVQVTAKVPGVDGAMTTVSTESATVRANATTTIVVFPTP